MAGQTCLLFCFHDSSTARDPEIRLLIHPGSYSTPYQQVSIDFKFLKDPRPDLV